MEALTVLEIQKANGGVLSPRLADAIGSELAKEPGIAAVWIAAENAGVPGRESRYLQFSVPSYGRSRSSGASEWLPTIDRAAALHRARVAVAWYENPDPDVVPAPIIEELGLGYTPNPGVTLARRIK